MPGHGIIIDQRTFNSNVQTVTKPNHVGGGDSRSNVGAETAGNVSCSNGYVTMLHQSAGPTSIVANDAGNTANGSAKSSSEKSNDHEGGLLATSRRYEVQNLRYGTSSLTRVADGNVGDSRINRAAEGCRSENGIGDSFGPDCNGIANEGTQRVDHGTGSFKGSIATSGVTQQLNNGSLDCENKKMNSLGTDLMRGSDANLSRALHSSIRWPLHRSHIASLDLNCNCPLSLDGILPSL